MNLKLNYKLLKSHILCSDKKNAVAGLKKGYCKRRFFLYRNISRD